MIRLFDKMAEEQIINEVPFCNTSTYFFEQLPEFISSTG